MNFSQAVQSVFSKYATFSGRASRSEFWFFTLFLFVVSFAFGLLTTLVSGNSFQPPIWVSTLYGIFYLATILPTLAVAVRRMHDIGKGGGWIFITLIPLIGEIWFIILAVTPSEPGPNRFGPYPIA